MLDTKVDASFYTEPFELTTTIKTMRLLPAFLAGYAVANHTDTAYNMDLDDASNELFEIMYCNNPTTDYPEMKIRVIHV